MAAVLVHMPFKNFGDHGQDQEGGGLGCACQPFQRTPSRSIGTHDGERLLALLLTSGLLYAIGLIEILQSISSKSPGQGLGDGGNGRGTVFHRRDEAIQADPANKPRVEDECANPALATTVRNAGPAMNLAQIAPILDVLMWI